MASDPLAIAVRDATLVAFDTETTGLRPVADKVIEIAAVKWRRGREVDRFQALIDPQRPIPADAAAIHGLTDAHVRGKPTVDHVLPKFLEFVQGSIALAHNARFDLGFLRYELSKGHCGPDVPVLDSCAVARRHLPPGGCSLDELVRRLGLGAQQEHRALADARHCLGVFLACARTVDESLGCAVRRLLPPGHEPANLADVPAVSVPRGWALLRNALQTRAAVEIVYAGTSGRTSVRIIRPQSIGFHAGAVYVEAHCLMAGARRTFHLDRIKRVSASSA